jgi:hypothetical protein
MPTPVLILLLVVLAALLTFLWIQARDYVQRRQTENDPDIRVESLTNDTVIDDDGAVRSIQAGDVWVATERFSGVWNPENLERLARTYWWNLGRMSLHTLRVMYTKDGRAMALFGLVPLITFHEPEYELGERNASVRWRIKRGLLVSQRGANRDGYLQIVVAHNESSRPGFDVLHVELSIANFYPAMAYRVSKRLYSATQSRIHVFVAYGFLRSLAHGNLAPSKVGRFAQWPKALDDRRQARAARGDHK